MTKAEYLRRMKALNAQLATLRKEYRKTAFKRAAKDFADGWPSISQVARKHALTPRELETYLNSTGHMQKRAAIQAETYATLNRVAREFEESKVNKTRRRP